MDRLILFLIYSLFVYSVGIVCSKKDFFSVDFLKRNWPDFIYFLFVGLASFLVIQKYWQMDSQNTVQILILLVTASALVYEGFASKAFRRYLDKPIIKIYFDDAMPEFFHRTIMRIKTEILITDSNSTRVIPLINFVPTYYARLKISNEGNTLSENTEVVVEKVEPLEGTELLRVFMRLNLYWAFAEEKERRKINITPNKSYKIADFIELTNPRKTREYADKLVPENVDYDRYHALTTGFRICSVPPNTLSDIYEKGSYVFTIGIYSNNIKPIYKRLLVEYDGEWDDNPDIMRENHLKVSLID